MPKFPNVKVKLVGQDGNAFAILGRVKNEMRKKNVPADAISAYMAEAMAGDYDNLLRVTCDYVDVR